MISSKAECTVLQWHNMYLPEFFPPYMTMRLLETITTQLPWQRYSNVKAADSCNQFKTRSPCNISPDVLCTLTSGIPCTLTSSIPCTLTSGISCTLTSGIPCTLTSCIPYILTSSIPLHPLIRYSLRPHIWYPLWVSSALSKLVTHAFMSSVSTHSLPRHPQYPLHPRPRYSPHQYRQRPHPR